jgi:predicted DNA-binding transcriptional regulator AlpA
MITQGSTAAETVKLLTEKEVSSMLSVSLKKLQGDRMLRKGLPYVKLGRSVRYVLSDIKTHLEQCRIDHESATR